ncbi:glycine zipper 2TM domain-containing protein [Luteimonas lutimaris]|uniref:Glycine zipper 2TM domain-containing protein n=1 Tax=Luteimonas lutimaris TaxID=698645 RepID=A0ABP7MG24_9GAMM
MNKNTIAIAIAALLVGGVSVAAFQHARAPDNGLDAITAQDDPAAIEALQDDTATDNSIPDGGRVAYAAVVDVEPVTEKEKLYATVIGTEPLSQTSTTSTPREVCEDVAVQERLPERDGNVGGTVAGAVIGGLLGNQVGKGNGKKAATAAGAVAGGFVGNRVDRNHVGGKVVARTERQCHTVTDTSESSKVVGYNVTIRNPDGSTETRRMDSKPGSRISLGTQDKTVGYDVTYRYDGQERTIRMDQKPGDRLPVIDGQVVTQTAAAASADRG